MSRNDFIAQTSARLAAFGKVVDGRLFVNQAIILADALEAAAVAPWGPRPEQACGYRWSMREMEMFCMQWPGHPGSHEAFEGWTHPRTSEAT